MGVELDEGEEEVIGEASAFEGLVEEGVDGVKEVGVGEFGDEGGAEGFSGVEVFAGGVEVEEGDGGGRVVEGVAEGGGLFWGKPVFLLEPCENGSVSVCVWLCAEPQPWFVVGSERGNQSTGSRNHLCPGKHGG